MKKLSLLILSMTVAAFAHASIQELNEGLDRNNMGNWSNAGSNFAGITDNIEANGGTWFASNGMFFHKAPYGATDGVTANEGFVGIYRGAVGDTVAATYSFTAAGPIRQQIWEIKASVNRSHGYTAGLQLSVQVNGGGYTTVGSSSTFYNAGASGDIFVDSPAAGTAFDGPSETRVANLSSLGIQAGDAVDYRITYTGGSRSIGLSVRFLDSVTAGILELNEGLDRVETGRWANTGAFPTIRDNIDANGDNWFGENGTHFLKSPYGADDGTTEAEGFFGLYRGANGDDVAATYSFVAPADLTLQSWEIKAIVNRVDTNNSALRFSVQVNGSGFTTVDVSSIFYSGTASGDIFISNPAGGFGIDGPTETRVADLTSLGIQEGDEVAYRIEYAFPSRRIGLGAQFTGNIPLGDEDPFLITSAFPDAGSFKLTFPTETGKYYQVQYTLSLLPGEVEWLVLVPNTAGDGNVLELEDETPADLIFYRVAVADVPFPEE